MKKILAILIGLAFFASSSAMGCSIPVFRLALEKWDLTTYEILVYHRGPLPADLQKTLDRLNAAPGKANVDVTFIDLDAKRTTNLRNSQINLWKNEATGREIPWMLVRYEVRHEAPLTAWSGPCTVANLNILLDSPMRKAILAHLTRGASGVFVLMTSGDEKEDRAALEMMQAKLQSLEKKIKLPEPTKDGPQMTWRLPLRVGLPILVLDRTKPEEAALVRMLLNTGEELAKAKGPIVFPIYGKGRVLPGLAGADLNEKYLFMVTEFLCGPCSCTIKAANPGKDLLMTANWKEIENTLFAGKEPVPMPAESFTTLPRYAPALKPR